MDPKHSIIKNCRLKSGKFGQLVKFGNNLVHFIF